MENKVKSANRSSSSSNVKRKMMMKTVPRPLSSSSVKTGKHLVQLTPVVVIKKIVQHAKDPTSPRLLKYLQELKRTFTSSNLKLWMDLRTNGGLTAIESIVRTNCWTVEEVGTPVLSFSPNEEEGTQEESYKIKHEVVLSSLGILANAYSLDYCARKDVAESRFIETLHQVIQRSDDEGGVIGNTQIPGRLGGSLKPFSVIERDIKTKAVKCVANLAHDSSCRNGILKLGVAVSILNLLERLNVYFGEVQLAKKHSNVSESSGAPAPPTTPPASGSALMTEYLECTKAVVRAIRILTSDLFYTEEVKQQLIRFKAVSIVGFTLNWVDQPDIQVDIIRSLANLTDKIRLLPTEQIQMLISHDNGNLIIKNLVALFEKCSIDSQLFHPVVRCLTNFSSNPQISEALGRNLIFKVTLEKFPNADEPRKKELCRLLVTLTKHSVVFLNSCHEIWTTLTVLKSDSMQHYHKWLLHIYENVYEGPLKCLLNNGLIDLIHRHFIKELEDCDFDVLKNKIMTLDESICKVHGEECSFVPRYRCDSPSYQQVQEEMKYFLEDRNNQKMELESGSSGVDSLSSPGSSPARSWNSEDSIASSCSEDEGCYSPVDPGALSLSPTYSETSEGVSDISIAGSSISEMWQRQECVPSPGPCVKRRKLNTMAHIPLVEKDEDLPQSVRMGNDLRNRTKKIVLMLNILHRISFLTPIPTSLIDIVPILLSFIVRGVFSLTPHKLKYENLSDDPEMRKLGQRSFSLAYKILKKILLDIHFFPEIVKQGTATVLTWLLPWDDTLQRAGGNASTDSISVLLDTLSGKENDTSGWREGHLLRTLMIGTESGDIDAVAIAIPLIFKKNDHVLRNFELKGNCWTRIFDLLTNFAEISTSVFQDCILAITTLSTTVGTTFERIDVQERPIVSRPKIPDSMKLIQFLEDNEEKMKIDNEETSSDGNVEIVLDDGTTALVNKTILTDASPVFSAMFDGHFQEAGSQKVTIRNISKETLSALIEQLQVLVTKDLESQSSTEDKYDLTTLFELLSASDQFLLQPIYERTLNTLLEYTCPYSAPVIYREAVQLSTLFRPEGHQKGWDMDLTFVILRYLLVGDISMNSRCCAFRKIFETVPPQTVVGDLRALIEFYSSRPQRRVDSR